jgi:hypothetical protein
MVGNKYFIAIAFELCFRMCHWGVSGKPEGLKIVLYTPASGLC